MPEPAKVIEVWSDVKLLDLEDAAEELRCIAEQLRGCQEDETVGDTVGTTVAETVQRAEDLIDQIGTFAAE